jgi:hypothetical protein
MTGPKWQQDFFRNAKNIVKQSNLDSEAREGNQKLMRELMAGQDLKTTAARG